MINYASFLETGLHSHEQGLSIILAAYERRQRRQIRDLAAPNLVNLRLCPLTSSARLDVRTKIRLHEVSVRLSSGTFERLFF